jgi:putative SOS response-associated peptidase YedK
MCSRYTYNKDEAKLKLRNKIEVFGCVPRGDIRPTDLGPVIIPEHEGFEMTWGWRVPWDKKPLINAKSETITQLPTFKPQLQNRCLILADGFFEKGIRFIQPGEPLFAMAALWQPDTEGNKFTLLTTTPNASVSPYHHRMPFILRAEQLGAWLGDDWLQVLVNPDRAPLEKIQKQPELFSTPAVARADGTTGRKEKPSTRPHRNQIRQSPSA